MNQGKTKVAHITFDMGIGGTEQVICQLVRAIDSVEHCVYCVDGGPGALGEALRLEGCPVRAFSRRPGFDLALIKALRAAVLDDKVSILHCHQYTPFVYGVAAAVGRPATVFFTEHGRFYPDSGSWKRRLLNPVLVARTEAVTAISAATAKALESFEGIALSRIDVIYNGIEEHPVATQSREEMLLELGVEHDARVVGSIGRLDPIKNFPMMIQAFGRIAQRYPKARLVIVGDGPARCEIEQTVRSAGLSDAVRLPGFLERPRRLLPVFDSFLLSSFSEGTSMSLLESMAAGVPAVVTRVGGNADLVADGLSGVVVESEDEKGFSLALESLVADEALRNSMGVAARQRYLYRFTAKDMAENYKRLYGRCE